MYTVREAQVSLKILKTKTKTCLNIRYNKNYLICQVILLHILYMRLKSLTTTNCSIQLMSTSKYTSIILISELFFLKIL